MPGKGTLSGVNRIYSFIRKSSENFQRHARFLQADLKNFFVSINKSILNDLVLSRVEEPHLRKIISDVIFHDPTENPIFNSPKCTFRLVPYHKSLFNSDFYHGLPIGNLTSQFFANIYLNDLDQFVKRKLKVKFYGRYIDDLVMVSRDIDFLNECFEEMKCFVQEKLDVEFHPNKTIKNNIDKGINFCGQIIKPYRKYIRNRTKESLKSVINKQYKLNHKDFKCSLNSYLGILKWSNCYNLKKNLVKDIDIPFDENYNKIKNFNLV